MKTYMLALVAVAALGQVDTNVRLNKRVYELEKEVRILSSYYNANAGTEYAMSEQDSKIFSDIVRATRGVAHGDIPKAVARVREILSAPIEPEPKPEPEKTERGGFAGRDRNEKGGKDRGVVGE